MLRIRRLTPLIALFSLSLVACSSGDQSSESAANQSSSVSEGPQDGGTVIRRLRSDCKTLNWMLATTVPEDYVLRMLYDPLIDVDAQLELTPVLAESWEITDEGRRITVTLRDSIFWHDGKPITAEDIAFTVNSIQNPTIPAVNKEGYFTKLDRVEIVDTRTVTFLWKERYAPAMFAVTTVSPIPKHIYDVPDFMANPANRKPVGSGPFRFETWESAQYISLVRSENYWGPKAHLDRVIFRIIPDDAVALNALVAGELDEMRLNQAQWEKETISDEFLAKFEKHHYYIPSYNYIGWNCRSLLFKDKRVRLAMTYLFDRETINQTIYSGYAKLISGPFYINSWAYNRSIKPHPFDPKRAIELLEEAGWKDEDKDGIREKNGVRFEFELILIEGSSVARQFCLILQEECAKIGVRVEIRPLEGSSFHERVQKGEYDACLLSWRLDLDPDIYDTFHSSQVPPIGLNHTFYSNAKVDSLLEAGRVEFDRDKRAAIYHELHRVMHDDPPYTFINAVPEKRPIHKRIKNVVVSPNGPFNYYPGPNYWYIDEATHAAVEK